jgi:hypothetical protein
MKKAGWKMLITAATVAAWFLVYAARGQEPAAEGSLAPGTGIQAELNGGLDSKKVKEGDTVNLHVIEPVKSRDDRTILPRGTKLVGHITEAKAKSKGAPESSLGIAFDKAILKDGHEMPLNVITQAVAAPVSFASASGGPGPETSSLGTQRTSPMGGGGRSSGAPQSQSTGPVTDPASAGRVGPEGGSSEPLGASSHGVVGLNGLTLNTSRNNKTLVSTLTSDGKNVHLDSGTRFLLVAQTAEPQGQ